jgi:O-antigen/teichoic acid export membrane protein
MLNVLPYTLNWRLDQLMMAALLEPKMLGLYVVAVAWGNVAAPLLAAVGPVLFPRISALENSEQRTNYLMKVIRYNVVGVLGLTAIVFALTPFMIPLLFGKPYESAIPTALVLVIAGAFQSINQTLSDGLRGAGQPRNILVAELTGLVITLVSLPLLLQILSILGAAIASLLAYSTTTLTLAIAVTRLQKLTRA